MQSFASVDWMHILSIVALGLVAWFALRALLRIARRRCSPAPTIWRTRSAINTVLPRHQVRGERRARGAGRDADPVELRRLDRAAAGAAGVAGVAIGLAAQGIAKDFIRGLSLRGIDNQIRGRRHHRDSPQGGVVEEVTLRHVTLRDYEGTCISSRWATFTSSPTVLWLLVRAARHRIGYDADVDKAMQTMPRGRRRPGSRSRVPEPGAGGRSRFAGVDRWADSSSSIKSRIKVPPGSAGRGAYAKCCAGCKKRFRPVGRHRHSLPAHDTRDAEHGRGRWTGPTGPDAAERGAGTTDHACD